MTTASGLDTVHIGNAVAINRDAYWGNGFDPCKVWDGFADIRDIGLTSYDATPSAADGAAGAVTAGVHLIRLRYMRGPAEYPGDASPSYSYTAPGSKKVSIPVIGTSAAGVDTIVIEMTTAGGATYYEAARVANTSTTITTNPSDTTLAANGIGFDAYGHYGPRPGSVLLEHKGSLMVGVPAIHSDGTVQVSGTTVIGTGTNWKSAVGDDWWFLASGQTVASRISTYNSGTSVTLEATATIATGATYKMWSPQQNKIELSKPLYPESFGDANGARRQQEVLQGKSDVLKSFISWNGYVIIFGDHSMERWTWTQDYAIDGQIYQIPGSRGTVNSKTVQNIEGVLFSWDKLGMFRWAGGAPESISNDIDNMFDNVNWAQISKFHSVFDPDRRLLMWFCATGSHTEPRTAFVYNVDEGMWHTRAYDFGWTAATVGPDNLGFQRPYFCDENGFTWFDGIGHRDGYHPTGSVTLTVDSGSTATSVTLGRTDTIYHKGGSGMAGVPCYWDEGAVTFWPTSNNATGNTIHPASALASAPSTGDTIWAGTTNFRFRSMAYNLGGTDNEQHGRYLGLDFLPTPNAQYLKVRMYPNFATAPRTDWATVSDGQEGVAYTEGNADVVVDLSTVSGNVKIALSDEWNEYITFEFEVDTPDVRMALLGYYLINDTEREQQL